MAEYSYAKATETTWQGSPIYDVTRLSDGVVLGQIERVTASTDTKIKGTRLRRVGKGREEWRPRVYPSWPSGLSSLTRGEAARNLERHIEQEAEIDG